VAQLLGGAKESHKIPQDSRSPGRDLNLGSPEYEAGVLTTRARWNGSLESVFVCNSRSAETEGR
jgi:hypothetical protein